MPVSRNRRDWRRSWENIVYRVFAVWAVAAAMSLGTLCFYEGRPVYLVQMNGELMQPSFSEDQYVMVFNWAWFFSAPEPGDVVSHSNGDGALVLRVVPCESPDWEGPHFSETPEDMEGLENDPEQPFFCGAPDNPHYRRGWPPMALSHGARWGKVIAIVKPLSAFGPIPPMPPMPSMPSDEEADGDDAGAEPTAAP